MQMIFYTVMAVNVGLMEKESIIQIPMEQAVPYPVPLPPIWQKAMIWIHQWSVPRRIFPVRWQRCWIWGRDQDLWTMDLIFTERDLQRSRHDYDRTAFRSHKRDLGGL